jgi:hypothetical protein
MTMPGLHLVADIPSLLERLKISSNITFSSATIDIIIEVAVIVGALANGISPLISPFDFKLI